jgi:hypothetical protein
MRRWLSRLMLVFIVLVAGQDQNRDLYLTNGEANGLLWRGMSSGEQRMFVTGVKYGAGAASISPLAGNPPSCPARVDTAKWYAVTNSELIREVDAFYESATNIPIPILGAVVYSLMKLGASTAELDQYRTQTLRTYVNRPDHLGGQVQGEQGRYCAPSGGLIFLIENRI